MNKLDFLSEKEYSEYEKFVLKHKQGSIFQSVDWAKFKILSNTREEKYWIIAKKDDGKNIVGGALVFKMKLFKKYSFLYCPRGPLGISGEELFLFLKNKVAKKEKAVFFRMDPFVLKKDGVLSGGFKKSHSPQPENTLILGLKMSEEELLKQMKQKGRYNIKVALKNGVEVFKSEEGEDVIKFYELLSETTQRDGFSGHPLHYYQKMLEILGAKGLCELYLAKYKGEKIAGIISTRYKDTVIYYYGASSNNFRNVMAPYLLQWTLIQNAKKSGCKYYDFLGISPEDAKNHPWKKVTDFKLKFGGERVNYFPAQEKPFIKSVYYLYKLYSRVRRR